MTSEQQEISDVVSENSNQLDDEVQSIAKRFYSNTPEDWEFSKLNDVVENFIDYRGKTPPKAESGIHTISAANIKHGFILRQREEKFVSEETYDEWTTRGIPTKGDVIITTEAPVGEVGMIREEETLLPTQRLITMSAGDQLSATYLKFCLQYERTQKQLESYAGGTTVSSFNQTDLRKTVIPLPSLPEQQKIGSILNNIELKIKLNNQINNRLERAADAIYESWFVDFKPFDDFKQTENGEIPASFEVGTLSDIAEINHNRIDPSEQAQTDYYLFSFSGYDENQLPEIQPGEDINSQKYVVSNSTVLVSKLNPRIPRVWRVRLTPENSISSTEFVNLSASNEEALNYIYSIARSDNFQSYLESHTTGTSGSHQRVKQKDILNYSLALLTREDLKRFNSIISPIYDRISHNREENRRLRKLIGILLPKLMSGEIRVNDIELDELEVDSEV